MSIFQSILLGFIQGLTEFIPVSSTAHLLIAQKVLGIPASDEMFSFLVIVQLGTIVSLIVYFAKDLWIILKAFFAKPFSTTENKQAWFILIATIPALVAGYLLKNQVEMLFKTPLLEASIRLFAAAILLFLAERYSRKSRVLESMTWLDALIVGLFQIISVFPGASRSGTTISAGMFRGFNRKAAARFAFLMSVPVMLAAGGYEMLDVINLPNPVSILPALAIGFIVAAIVGWFAIRWLLAYLGKHSLYIFAGYCAFVGLSLAIIQFL